MPNVKRSWQLLDDAQKRLAIENIIKFFETERDEKIGQIAAEQILDSLLSISGNHIYNKGVEDTKNFLKSRFEYDLIDLEASLKKG